MDQLLDIETILAADPARQPVQSRSIGHSRQGRSIHAFVLGNGPIRISLIGGCHADEPVGPAMLEKLVAYLGQLRSTDRLLTERRWHIVPHVNPDGAAVNAAWSDFTQPTIDHRNAPDEAYDLVAYVEQVVRELPGDDIEFGFPRNRADLDARPENLAVAGFLRSEGPFHLHASFHGMGLAPGPWFLLEPSWADRTTAMRDSLRDRVRSIGYRPMDLDRKGEKGFCRIDEGFSTRPDSRAMIAHFEALGDDETAALFRPSSMEFVRRLGGDPLTLVSEMPLFLVPEASEDRDAPRFEKGTEGRKRLLAWLQDLVSGKPSEVARRAVTEAGIHAMPIRDQMRLQLAFLDQALALLKAE
jgi:hypothetical protein